MNSKIREEKKKTPLIQFKCLIDGSTNIQVPLLQGCQRFLCPVCFGELIVESYPDKGEIHFWTKKAMA